MHNPESIIFETKTELKQECFSPGTTISIMIDDAMKESKQNEEPGSREKKHKTCNIRRTLICR